MNFARLIFCALVYLTTKNHGATRVLSLSMDEFDSARQALVGAANNVITKRARTLTTSKIIRLTKSGIGSKGWTTGKVVTKVVKTSKPRNNNKFNEVMEQVLNAMAQAQLSRKAFRLTVLLRDIVNAVNKGNNRFARRVLGLAFYIASTGKSRSRGRGKRSPGSSVGGILAKVKKDLGDEKFSDFLALQGEVTLMYAVDITGSMREEIQAAKDIVIQISRYDRSEPVDYILSSFGDPISQGSVVYKPDDQVTAFTNEVGKLKANGGGDCAEYAYEGMINALYEDPRMGSPLYVFTDAPPKDATEENKETLNVLAKDLGITINFFVGKSCIQSPYDFENFKKVAEEHGGQFLELKDTELKNMAGFAGSALGGSTAVVSGTSKAARRKRSTTTQIAIPVDDTVSQLVVTVTTTNSPGGIRLVTPSGTTQKLGRTILTKVIVYNIESPLKGTWKLLVPSSVGKFEYSAKVTSSENVDFEHHYTKTDRRKRRIQVRSPLAGEQANVNLAVFGVGKIKASSLSVDVIDISGKVLISNKKLTPVGKSGVRYSFVFVPPSTPYKLMLKGITKRNKHFQRISRHVDGAKSLVLKEYYNSKHYTIKQGGSTFIILYLFNGSKKTQKFQVFFKDTLGYKVYLSGRQRLSVRPGKKLMKVRVQYNGGKKGEVGQTENVIIIVKGNGVVTAEVVPLMIV